jgi:hypothetical protein
MMSNEKGTRVERTQQTLNPAGNFSFGHEAILGHTQSARRILLLAQAEMRRHHGNENFLTALGPSAILLAFTGLETFVNYTLYICFLHLEAKDDFRRLIEEDRFLDKFRQISVLATRRPELQASDIELVQQVRNEIVHYYPRTIGTETRVPSWLQALADKDLLVESPIAGNDFGWQTKMTSYALARWCAAAVARGAEEFANALYLEGQENEAHGFVASHAQSTAEHFRDLIV